MFGFGMRRDGGAAAAGRGAGIDPDAEVLLEIDAFAASLRRDEAACEAEPPTGEDASTTPP